MGGRARAGLQASSQSPHNGEERWEGAMPQGVGGLGKPVSEQQLLLHPRAVLSLPPPACFSRQLPKAGPGAGLAGAAGLLNAPAGSKAVAAAERGGRSPWHVLVPISWPGSPVTGRQGEHVLLQPGLTQAGLIQHHEKKNWGRSWLRPVVCCCGAGGGRAQELAAAQGRQHAGEPKAEDTA